MLNKLESVVQCMRDAEEIRQLLCFRKLSAGDCCNLKVLETLERRDVPVTCPISNADETRADLAFTTMLIHIPSPGALLLLSITRPLERPYADYALAGKCSPNMGLPLLDCC